MITLVTGAAGLIGMELRALLPARGHRVVAVDRTGFGRDDPDLHLVPLDDLDAMCALAQRHGVDSVVHCGAISGPMMARGRPLDIVASNIDGTANVLELARLGGLSRVVFCSSISVYGDVGDAVMTEEKAPHPTSVYGASKMAGEQLVEGYAAEYGVDGVSLRIGRVYGRHRRADCLIRDMIAAAQTGEEAVIPCAPDFLYHYVWAGDVAQAILAALTAPRLPSRVYNVGSGQALTMPDIVDVARTVLPGLRARVVPGIDDVPDVQKIFDVARIADELGFRAAHDMARGIAAYAGAWRGATV